MRIIFNDFFPSFLWLLFIFITATVFSYFKRNFNCIYFQFYCVLIFLFGPRFPWNIMKSGDRFSQLLFVCAKGKFNKHWLFYRVHRFWIDFKRQGFNILPHSTDPVCEVQNFSIFHNEQKITCWGYVETEW